jgi:hypothetical protein
MMATLPEKRVGQNTWLWDTLMMQRRSRGAYLLLLSLAVGQRAEVCVLKRSAAALQRHDQQQRWRRRQDEAKEDTPSEQLNNAG